MSFRVQRGFAYMHWFRHAIRSSNTGCSINIVFFRRFLNILRTLAFLGFPSVSVCMYTMAGQTPAQQQNQQSSEKSQHFKGKYLIFNEHPVVKKISKIKQSYQICMDKTIRYKRYKNQTIAKPAKSMINDQDLSYLVY